MKKVIYTTFCFSLMAALAHAQAPVTELIPTNLNPPGFVPVNGLVVGPITFTDTSGADYDAGNDGNLNFTQDPVIEGPTGGETLTMTFGIPVFSLQFGLAVSTQGSFPNIATVQLFDAAGNLIGTFPVSGGQLPTDNFTDGFFSHISSEPIAKAVITFNTAIASAFGLGNIAVNAGGPLRIGYAANLNIGDSVVNLTNDGSFGGFIGAGTTGNICANVYVFDPQEEEIGCCACLVTPNGLNALSAKNDLIGNNLTPAIPNSIVIKLVGSRPAQSATGAFTVCDPSTVGATTTTAVALGLQAWGTTLEPASNPGTYSPVEAPFHIGTLRAPSLVNPPAAGSELAGMTSLCSFIQADGSGFGICGSCQTGALAGTKK
jgi:hypothetical protein